MGRRNKHDYGRNIGGKERERDIIERLREIAKQQKKFEKTYNPIKLKKEIQEIRKKNEKMFEKFTLIPMNELVNE